MLFGSTLRFTLCGAALAVLVFGPLPFARPAAAQGGFNNHRPIWSPDGRDIVFMSDRSGDWELYRMRLDGTRLERLTDHAGWDGYASYSPDGTRLSYDRGDDHGRRIMTYDFETERHTETLSGDQFFGGPRWAPDGSLIVFMDERTGARNLYLMQPDGSGVTMITDLPEDESDPAFAPDGGRLAVVVDLGERSAIDIVDLRGHDRERILESSGRIYGLDWSPDGNRIAFNSDEDGDQEIYLVDIDGHHRRQLTRNDIPDHQPQWSPDGSRLLFTTEGEWEEIFVIDRDGRYQIRVGTD